MAAILLAGVFGAPLLQAFCSVSASHLILLRTIRNSVLSYFHTGDEKAEGNEAAWLGHSHAAGVWGSLSLLFQRT